ncbi:MAG: putative metallopeptidase [Deltaproteobacteria bacterium]|nr:putative metallopeptidase [Deltaproteobacteria bacterium]
MGSAFHDKRGLKPLDQDVPRCYKVSMKFLFKTGCFSLLSIFVWVSAFAASGPITVNVDVPPGQWKAARLKNLPKDAMVAVQVESTGEILVALIHAKAFQNSPDNLRPLFTGRVERKLSFSIAVVEQGDHYLIFDNRRGAESRAVTVTLQAAQAEKDRTQAAGAILREFEKQLHRLFVFDPFPIGVKQCGAPRAFADEPGVFLCTEYVYHLHEALRDQEKAKDFLSFSIFHEVARQLLQKWNHPEAGKEEGVDELAVALMVMLNQKSRALGAADFAVKNPSAFNTMTKLFQDHRHPLSAKRGRNVLNWAKDSDFPKKWQAFLVPHMQTALLKKLKQKPTSWTDLSLVEKELAARDKKAI